MNIALVGFNPRQRVCADIGTTGAVGMQGYDQVGHR
jgi:hypothetical protein